MAADEEEPQDVVAVIGHVDPLDERRLRVREVGERLLRRQRPLARPGAHAIDPGVAPDHDEPGGGVARRAVHRPGLQGAQAGLLERLLGPVEVAEPAQEGRDRLRPRAGQDRADPALVGHPGAVPACRGRWGGSRRRRPDWPARARAHRRSPPRDRRSRRRRSREAAPWSRRTARRGRARARGRCGRSSPHSSAAGGRPARACRSPRSYRARRRASPSPRRRAPSTRRRSRPRRGSRGWRTSSRSSPVFRRS
jgi:hypothetical protein